MAQFDTVITNGTTVDGTRVPCYKADIGAKDSKITVITQPSCSDVKKESDAAGLIVAPGFIDLHTHYGAQGDRHPFYSYPPVETYAPHIEE